VFVAVWSSKEQAGNERERERERKKAREREEGGEFLWVSGNGFSIA